MGQDRSRRGAALRLTRSSSFRLMLVFAAFFTLSSLVLFAIVFVSTDGFMTRQIDATVANEMAEISADAGGDPARLRDVIGTLVRNAPGFFYLLQDAQGRVVVGNMAALPPRAGRRTLELPVLGPSVASGRRMIHVRGQGRFLPDGVYLFVGSDEAARLAMRRSLVGAFLWSLGAIAAIGLIGGLVMAMLVLRRIEAISVGIRAIMAGDLTQRIALGGSGDEFDHLSGTLNAMLERIESLVQGMRQISNDIAHDLRTPLTRLRQGLELATRRPASAEALRGQVEIATAQVDQILVTFSALLRIAQIESQAALERGFAPVALGPLIETMLEVFGPVAEERGQHLAARLDAGQLALSVRGDKPLLGQLLANLIENALRHTQDGSHIVVEARRVADGLALTVSDDGPGIPAAEHAFVLRRFARLDASRSTPGNGLGLSLVKAIAAHHGATLRLLDNAPGLACVVVFPVA